MSKILTILLLTTFMLVTAPHTLASGLTPSMGATEITDNKQPTAKTILEYSLSYTNNMSEIFNKPLVVTGPIPHNAKFVPEAYDSTVLATCLVSYDNGKTYQPAYTPSENITHIRWLVKGQSLMPSRSWTFKYRVQIPI